jgi:hypothetical protein
MVGNASGAPAQAFSMDGIHGEKNITVPAVPR